jgi:hypothetical protein
MYLNYDTLHSQTLKLLETIPQNSYLYKKCCIMKPRTEQMSIFEITKTDIHNTYRLIQKCVDHSIFFSL